MLQPDSNKSIYRITSYNVCYTKLLRKLLGEIEVDLNGYHKGIERYSFNNHMSNVKIILRHDGRYMIVARSTAVMISDNGILGPYKVMSDRVYKAYPELPQEKNEDPTVWYSGGRYHIVYNHWPSKTSHHFTSENGINDWIYRGKAFKKGESRIVITSYSIHYTKLYDSEVK